MEDQDKTKEGLINELVELRQRVAELEAADTDRRQAEEALRESEEDLRAIFNGVGDGIALIDVTGKVIKVNKRIMEIGGYTEDEIIGKRVVLFKMFPPQSLAKMLSNFAKLISGQYCPPFDIEVYTKAGEKLDVELRGSLLRKKGKVVGIVGVMRDITDRKRAEKRVRRLLDQQIVVNRLVLALGESRDLNRVYHTIYEHVRALMDAEAFIVSFCDDETQLIRAGYVVAEGTVRDAATLPPIPLQEVEYGTQSQVIHTGEPFYIPDLRKAMERSRTEHTIYEDGTVVEGPPPPGREDISRSALYVPMKIEGETIGVMQVQSFRLDAYNQEDIDLLSAMANVAAIAIENARLYEVEQERSHIAETLRQASTVLSSTLELDEVLGLILQQLRQVIPYDSASIQRLESAALSPSKGDRLEIVACQGFEESDKVVGLVFPLDPKFPNHHVVTTKAPLAIEDVVHDYPHFKDEADIYDSGRIRSWLGVPLMVKDQVIGIIAIDRAEVRPYTTEEAQLAMAFANQASIAIENARLYEQAQQEITERKRAEEQIKASLKEKEVLLKEIHHRVKNNLQVISSLLYLQSKNIKDKGTLAVFQESQNRVKSMTLVHERLYQSQDLARVDFAEYVRSLANHLFRSYGINTNVIQLKINTNDVFLGVDTAIPCGLILNELVSNVLKHAFPDGKEGEVRIELRADEGQLTLVVSDNGVGFPQDLDFRDTGSLGLQLVNTLVEQIEGTIELDRDVGTAFKITFTEPG
jgi:PAS domain S-box-containing protein